MTFEEKLKSLRLKNSMSQQAAAVALGISIRAYQHFESGEQRPGYENLIRIADLFQVSLDWLTGREKRNGKEALSMLPQDPYILLSVVNTKLRDQYPSLDALCGDLGEDKAVLTERLAGAGYAYDPAANQFRPI